MAQVGSYDLNDVSLFVGEAKLPLVGAADGDFITIEPDGDEGSLVLGANGDTMLVARQINGYTVTLELLATSTYITVLGTLRSLGNAFPIFFKLGASEFSGRAIIQNRGTETVSSAGATRTITLKVAKLTDTLAAQGTIIATGN